MFVFTMEGAKHHYVINESFSIISILIAIRIERKKYHAVCFLTTQLLGNWNEMNILWCDLTVNGKKSFEFLDFFKFIWIYNFLLYTTLMCTKHNIIFSTAHESKFTENDSLLLVYTF